MAGRLVHATRDASGTRFSRDWPGTLGMNSPLCLTRGSAVHQFATASAVTIEARVGARITGALARRVVDDVGTLVPGLSMGSASTSRVSVETGRVMCFATMVWDSDLRACVPAADR